MSGRKDAVWEDEGMRRKLGKAHYACLPGIYF